MNDRPNAVAAALDVLVAELAKLPPDERAATAAQISLMLENAALGLLDKHPEILGGVRVGDR